MLTFVTLVNDHEQFGRCRASLERGSPVEKWIVVEPNARGWNAARGLNHALDRASTPWVAFVHQDVVFPPEWDETMSRRLTALPESVAVVGISGTRRDGRFRGHIVDPNGHCFWGPLPAEVLTLDEVVLVLRRSSGLRFDERVPGFHCYGADLCLQAAARGLTVMSVDAPLLHLSTGRLDDSYQESARWLLERWGKDYGYVLPTPPANIQDERKANLFRKLLFRLRRRLDHQRRNHVPSGVRFEV